jgi:type VI secretion system protein ImpG
VVNLFEQSAEPVPLTPTRVEHRIVPTRAVPLAAEVYSVDEVTLVEPGRGAVPLQPFYSFAYDQSRDSCGAFWYAARRASPVEGDPGTEVHLILVDRGFDPRRPAEAMLDVRTTCTDRDRAARYHRAGDELRAAGVEWPARLLHQPTAPLRPPLRRGAHWRLLAQLSLNHAPLSDAADGRAALQEILRVCDFADPEQAQQLAAVNRQLVEGVLSLRPRLALAPATGRGRVGFCRGVAFTLELDEQRYVGTGTLLFASVLERFLGLYAGVNSFSQLSVRTRQAEGYLKRWPPRAAERQLR